MDYKMFFGKQDKRIQFLYRLTLWTMGDSVFYSRFYRTKELVEI